MKIKVPVTGSAISMTPPRYLLWLLRIQNFLNFFKICYFQSHTKICIGSDLGGVIDIADAVTGTFVFMKLGYLKNFMSNA